MVLTNSIFRGFLDCPARTMAEHGGLVTGDGRPAEWHTRSTESRALRLAGRKAEREKVWARVEEITAQIEVSTKELAEHMLSAELMPCPFCGGVAKHTFVMDDHWVSCTVCGVSGKIANTRQHAVDAWNTRTAYMPDDRRSGE